ncbi:ATP-grasp domain-containing protein [Mesorhizobium sp. M0184]|uniref:ATP-grasp domain-containing protein n=1 Tax=Mesorhizobium sp. M0184 TaxID=2956906 RepID=UPI003338C467
MGGMHDGYLVIVDPVAHFFRYVTSARTKGLKVLVLAANAELCREEEAAYARAADDYPTDGIERMLAWDGAEDASALAVLEPYRDRIRGLVAGDEVTVASTARIGRALGFPYASAEDARCQQIKSAMKLRLAERSVSTPPFAIVSTVDEAAHQWQRFGGDAMLKMVDYAMSFGVFRVKTRDELDAAWEQIRKGRGSLDHALPHEEAVLVEQHVTGREFSVEGYVSGDRVEILNFCEKLSHPNFMVVGHYIPAQTSAREERLLSDVASQSVTALGVRNSVFHAEIHVADDRAWLIECASRPPGQFSVSVLERVYGFDLMDISIDLACGNPIAVHRQSPRSWNAIMAIYSDRPCIVRSVDTLDALRNRPECYSVICAVRAGDVVNRLETFRDVLGLAMLESPDPDGVRAAYQWARDTVRF